MKDAKIWNGGNSDIWNESKGQDWCQQVNNGGTTYWTVDVVKRNDGHPLQFRHRTKVFVAECVEQGWAPFLFPRATQICFTGLRATVICFWCDKLFVSDEEDNFELNLCKSVITSARKQRVWIMWW